MNWYLFGGYTAIWTVLFIFLAYLNHKQRRLADDLRTLSEERRHPTENSPNEG